MNSVHLCAHCATPVPSLPGLRDDRPHCAISCREASVVAAHRRLIEELTS